MVDQPQTPPEPMSSQPEPAEGLGASGAAYTAAVEPETELSAQQLAGLLEDARAKADAHWDQLLRARADLENERRRAQRDLESSHKFGLEKFVLELLPVKDSLELGLSVSAEAQNPDKLREGMELTLRMMAAAFEKFGIVELNPVGERFNPDFHQAMSAVETDKAEANTVVTVYQKGYLLNERLLRPALVVVAKAPSTEQDKA
jgi:molecular chaperone GrpE